MAIWQIIKRQSRRPLMPMLVIAQVALACAITCNALFLLSQQLAPVLAPDGINDPSRLVFITSIAPRGIPWSAVRMRAVKAELSAVPGVSEVSYAATLPMIRSGQMTRDIRTGDGHSKIIAAFYFGDSLVKTLGLHLVAGRDFTSGEQAINLDLGAMMGGQYDTAIITQALANKLFAHGDAVGQLLPDSNTRIIGIVSHLVPNNTAQGNDVSEYAILVAGVAQQWPVPMFAVRIADTDTNPVCKKLIGVVKQDLGSEMLPGFDMACDAYPTLRDQAIAAPLAAVWLLSGVTLIVLIVTITGIMGMTGYWVQQRTRSIGVCRALGARRSDVWREILIENAVVVAVGAILGLAVAYGINVWLMQHYELAHLPAGYFPIGAVALLVLGQLAALAPARRATNIPPIVATRAV